MDDNRQSGRRKNVTGSVDGAHRSGEGLGTGPVGSQDGYSGRRRRGSVSLGDSHEGSSGGSHPLATRAGGISILSILAIVVYMIFGSKLGGTTTEPEPEPNGPQQTAETQPDNSVVKGARAKYTTIKGNGKDVVTILVYMCGTDLESDELSGAATDDVSQMMSASSNASRRLAEELS